MNLQKYKLPILKVIECNDSELPYTGDGILINSPLLEGLSKDKAIDKIIELIETKKIGQKSIKYKLRDWAFQDKDTGDVLYQQFIMKMDHIVF